MSLHAPLDFGLFAPPEPSEAEKGREVVQKMADRERTWLDPIRDEMRALYRRRVAAWGPAEEAFVCGDDVRRLLERRPELGPPAGVSNNALAAVWRERGWVRLAGKHVSKTPGSNGNEIARWAWRED